MKDINVILMNVCKQLNEQHQQNYYYEIHVAEDHVSFLIDGVESLRMRLSLIQDDAARNSESKTVDFVVSNLNNLIKSNGNYPNDEPSFEEIKLQIFPLVRQKAVVEKLNYNEHKIADVIIQGKTKFKDLTVIFVIDLGSSMAFITTHHLETWGITQEELEGIAYANLAALPTELLELKTPDKKSYYMINTLDGYAATRLLTYDFTQLKEKVQGDLLISIPIRDMLVVFDSKDISPRKMMAMNVVKMSDADYPLLPDVYRFKRNFMEQIQPHRTVPLFSN